MKDTEQIRTLNLERVILVRVWVGAESADSSSMDEMIALVEAAGGEVAAETSQKKSRPDPSYFVGKGKAEEITELARSENVATIVLDHNLTPGQVTRLERTTGCKVIDRTELILAIFAGQARSREAILQIELAQLKYALPRLSGLWHHFSRLGAGIGTRGPGETQLEIDRRRARARISLLESGIAEMETRWQVAASRRSEFFRVAIVGYTNAGKSTLLNALCGASVYTADRPFATLDTTFRRVDLMDGSRILLSDTVGFIERLPETLVASFHTTLNSAREADLLLVAVDRSNPFRERHLETVRSTLDRVGVEPSIPRLIVWTKCDAERGFGEPSSGVAVSAFEGTGLDRLMEAITRIRNETLGWFRLELDRHDSSLINWMYGRCVIREISDRDDGTMTLVAGAPGGYPALARKLAGFGTVRSATAIAGYADVPGS
jgi:GTP-binding protein HflX